jgi:hypothetical protein
MAQKGEGDGRLNMVTDKYQNTRAVRALNRRRRGQCSQTEGALTHISFGSLAHFSLVHEHDTFSFFGQCQQVGTPPFITTGALHFVPIAATHSHGDNAHIEGCLLL